MSNLELAKEICVKQLLIPFEGTGPMTKDGKFKAYPDPASGAEPITISWGMTFHADGTKVKLGEVWDLDYATRTKAIILNKFLIGLLRSSPSLIKATPNRIAAVLSFVYNLGLGSYNISTYKKKIDKEFWNEAAEQGKKWNKAKGKVMKGLTRRRQAEANLLISG